MTEKSIDLPTVLDIGLRPMFAISNLSELQINMFIPLKYFRREYDLTQAQSLFVEHMTSILNGVSSKVNPLDMNVLHRDGYSSIFALTNLQNCDILVVVIPHKNIRIEVSSKQSG